MKHFRLLLLFMIICCTASAQYDDSLVIAGTDSVLYSEYDTKGRVQFVNTYVRGYRKTFREYFYFKDYYGYEEHFRNNDSVLIRDFYYNGKPKLVATMTDSGYTGAYLTFYENGNRECVFNYSQGRRSGVQRQFYENGNPEIYEECTNDSTNGYYMEFHENGNIRMEGVYIMEAQTDTFRYYYPDGARYTTAVYKNGRLQNVVVTYSPTGFLLDPGTLKDGNGNVREYDDKGVLISIDEYKDGKLVRSKRPKAQDY